MNAWLASKPVESVNKAVVAIETDMPDRITDAGGDRHFALWLYAVDRIIGRRLGVSYRDLPDQAWRDRYDADMSPSEATAEAIDQWRDNGDIPDYFA